MAREVTLTRFEANDGSRHDTLEEAEAWEWRLSIRAALEQIWYRDMQQHSIEDFIVDNFVLKPGLDKIIAKDY